MDLCQTDEDKKIGLRSWTTVLTQSCENMGKQDGNSYSQSIGAGYNTEEILIYRNCNCFE